STSLRLEWLRVMVYVTVSPTAAASGPDLVTEMSVNGSTSIECEAVLSPASPSSSSAVAVTVLVRRGPCVEMGRKVAAIVTVADSPGSSESIVHVGRAGSQEPFVVVADSKRRLSGRSSDTTTLCAVAVPLFVTLMV